MLTDHSRTVLSDRYTHNGEKPEDVFLRVAKYYKSDEAHGQRLYDYMKKMWFIPASPILANAGTKRGLPISCFLMTVPDSREGISNHFDESLWMSTSGGGIGADISQVRSAGTLTSRGIASTGVIQYLHIFDSLTLAGNQGTIRQGSYSSYLDVSHPEIVEFIRTRITSGGDVHRKNVNIHHGVNITDEFMQAVYYDLDWNLIDPHSKQVTSTVKATEIWNLLMETRLRMSEPYLHFIDRSNQHLHPDLKAKGRKIRGSNLCVAPETTILTDKGHIEIQTLANQMVNVWNGQIFTPAYVEQTSERSELLKVEFSDGSSIECTPYHKFHLNTKEVKEAQALNLGDKLQKCSYPIVIGGSPLRDAYTQGVFSGDGCRYDNKNHIDLYGEKVNLPITGKRWTVSALKQRVRVSDSYVKFYVPLENDLESRVLWFAGLLDSDGCLALNGATPALQIASIEFQFLNKVRLMLQTMGVSSKVTQLHSGGDRLMPDGKGGYSVYFCQPIWRLLIGVGGIVQLQKLGLKPHRLVLDEYSPNRDATQFIKVTKVTRTGRFDATYCFNEPIEHKGILNGILTGNCTEITLPTDDDYSAVCCLSSTNLNKYEEWTNEPLFIQDIAEFLDNVLNDFVQSAPKFLQRSVKSVLAERSIGIGGLGWHNFLQRGMMPFASVPAMGYNQKIWKEIKEKAIDADRVLCRERGSAEDLKSNRFAHMLAIAPNATTATIAGESQSIEPWDNNLFTQETVSGSMTKINPYLVEHLNKEYSLTEMPAVIHSIRTNKGSVQQLEKLSQEVKDVFKTAREIDQRVIVRQAADRQKYICQAQSVNLFFSADVDLDYVHTVHFDAWKQGLKTLYYMKTEDATQSGKGTSTKQDLDNSCFGCQG